MLILFFKEQTQILFTFESLKIDMLFKRIKNFLINEMMFVFYVESQKKNKF